MDTTKKYSIWIIFVSAILVAIFFNMRVYNLVLNLWETNGFRDIPDERNERIYFGLLRSGFHFMLFFIFALFNFSGREKFFGDKLSVRTSIFLIILANLIIYFFMIFLESKLFHHHFTFGRKLTPKYFIYANYAVAAVAIAEAYFLILYRKVRTSEIENALLKEQKTSAELAALKDQISPHFFFNTLSTLSAIIRNEKKDSGLEFIQDMSKTYRYTLSSGRQDLVKLNEELDFIRSYIFLLEKRFGNKLKFEIDIPEESLALNIPPMSLQLLIENAIQHNVITRDLPLIVKVFIKDNRVCVENNIQVKEVTDSLGLGLENLAKRYRLLSQKEIIIENDKLFFRVKLPLL